MEPKRELYRTRWGWSDVCEASPRQIHLQARLGYSSGSFLETITQTAQWVGQCFIPFIDGCASAFAQYKPLTHAVPGIAKEASVKGEKGIGQRHQERFLGRRAQLGRATLSA